MAERETLLTLAQSILCITGNVRNKTKEMADWLNTETLQMFAPTHPVFAFEHGAQHTENMLQSKQGNPGEEKACDLPSRSEKPLSMSSEGSRSFPETTFVDFGQFDGGQTGHFSVPDDLSQFV